MTYPSLYQGAGLVARYNQVRAQRVEQNVAVRRAEVLADALVCDEVLRSIDRLTRQAMVGQTMLRHWRGTLAQGDPFLDDELRFFTDIARVGKGEVIAGFVAIHSSPGQR